MKKGLVLICSLMILFSFSSCRKGKIDNVVISLGDSQKFSKVEIEAAADCVLKKFRDFEGCDLQRLWYDEIETNYYEIDNKKRLVFLSNFHVDASGGDGSFEPNTDYTDWKWIVIRDNESAEWIVEGWGY